MTPSGRVFDGGGRAIRISLLFFGIGATTLAIGAVLDRAQAFAAYLIACTFVVSIALGALIFLMICHAMRAGWPTAVRRILEAAIATFPVLALFFVPICVDLDAIYPWRHPDRFAGPEEHELLVHKLRYLNAPFFIARTVVFFAIWLVTAELLRRWSFRKDEDPTVDVESKLHRFSAGALPAVALAMSFAAFDWLMSLTPLWYSTMFPVYFFAGGFSAALAGLSLSTYLAQRNRLLLEITRSHWYALGRLLFAFTIFWAYAAFFQFMLMWIANRPDEVVFYVSRKNGPWAWITLFLVIGRFVVPFFLLLSYRVKQQGPSLAAIAAWMLFMHYVDVHWLVAPSLRGGRFPFHWLDLSALLTVAGLSVTAALLALRGHPLLPIHDPRLTEALRYESS